MNHWPYISTLSLILWSFLQRNLSHQLDSARCILQLPPQHAQFPIKCHQQFQSTMPDMYLPVLPSWNAFETYMKQQMKEEAPVKNVERCYHLSWMTYTLYRMYKCTETKDLMSKKKGTHWKPCSETKDFYTMSIKKGSTGRNLLSLRKAPISPRESGLAICKWNVVVRAQGRWTETFLALNQEPKTRQSRGIMTYKWRTSSAQTEPLKQRSSANTSVWC